MNKQMTRQDFDSFTDEDLVFDIFAHLCDIKQMDEDEKIFLDRLPEPAKFVFLIHVLDAEISNGGFNQYFFNTRCQFIDDTACALTAVSAIKHLNLFNLAVKQMRLQWHIHEENMTSAKSVTELLKNFSSSYDSIELGDEDSNWYKLEDELHSRMVKYIRENAASFIDA